MVLWRTNSPLWTASRTAIRSASSHRGGGSKSIDFADFKEAVPSGDDSVLIDLIERDITSIEIPSGVTTIGNCAFYECSSITSVEIPSSVASIGNNAFYNCRGLKYINSNVELVANLSSPLTSIGSNAFYGVSFIQKIILPSTMTSIGAQALRMASLQEIWCYATTPPTLGVNNQNYWTSLQAIYVPPESVEAYKTATYWSDKASIIQAIPTT